MLHSHAPAHTLDGTPHTSALLARISTSSPMQHPHTQAQRTTTAPLEHLPEISFLRKLEGQQAFVTAKDPQPLRQASKPWSTQTNTQTPATASGCSLRPEKPVSVSRLRKQSACPICQAEGIMRPKDPTTYHRALRPSLWMRNASSCSPSGTGNWRGNSADAAARMLVPKPCMHSQPSSALLYSSGLSKRKLACRAVLLVPKPLRCSNVP